MKLDFNLTGKDRKALATVIGHFVGVKPEYKMPGFRYVIGDVTVDEKGSVTLAPNSSLDPDALKLYLRASGFKAAKDKTPAEVYSVSIPANILDTDEATYNFENFLKAKGYLIKKAFNVEDLPYYKEGKSLVFPWFTEKPEQLEMLALSDFITCLTLYCKNAHHINPIEHQTDNDKYAFRTLLIRIGMGGERYKTARKILLRNLSGSSAFRHGTVKKETA